MNKSPKIHINDYLKQLKDDDLMLVVKNHLIWKETGSCNERTILDDFYDIYFKKLGASKLDCYYLLCTEISERLYNKNFKKD